MIDVKNKWFRKSLSEVRIIIYEELYDKDWYMTTANELGEQLEKFKIFISNSEEDEKEQVNTDRESSQFYQVLKIRLRQSRKDKGSAITRVHLYKQMKKGEWSMAEIAVGNNLSLETLYNIKKEFDIQTNRPTLEKATTRRNLVESSIIQNIVCTYLSKTKTPWSSKNIWAYIRAKTGLAIQQGTVRRVLIDTLGMRYKKGNSRLVTFDEELQSLIKQWFSIKIWKSIERLSYW